MALGVLAGRVAYDLNRIDQRHRLITKESDQLGDRGDPEHVDPSDQLRLSGLTQGHDHSREACLLSRQGGWQDAAHRPQTTIQPEFA